MSAMIACPHCGQGYAIAADRAGREVKCSRCGRTFVVPAGQTPALPGATIGPVSPVAPVSPQSVPTPPYAAPMPAHGSPGPIVAWPVAPAPQQAAGPSLLDGLMDASLASGAAGAAESSPVGAPTLGSYRYRRRRSVPPLVAAGVVGLCVLAGIVAAIVLWGHSGNNAPQPLAESPSTPAPNTGTQPMPAALASPTVSPTQRPKPSGQPSVPRVTPRPNPSPARWMSPSEVADYHIETNRQQLEVYRSIRDVASAQEAGRRQLEIAERVELGYQMIDRLTTEQRRQVRQILLEKDVYEREIDGELERLKRLSRQRLEIDAAYGTTVGPAHKRFEEILKKWDEKYPKR